MLGWAKRATDALMPKKIPRRYGILERKDGIVRTFDGVTDYGYREELGGTFFFVRFETGSYELAAEKCAEFQLREYEPATDETPEDLGGD